MNFDKSEFKIFVYAFIALLFFSVISGIEFELLYKAFLTSFIIILVKDYLVPDLNFLFETTVIVFIITILYQNSLNAFSGIFFTVLIFISTKFLVLNLFKGFITLNNKKITSKDLNNI